MQAQATLHHTLTLEIAEREDALAQLRYGMRSIAGSSPW